MRNYISRNIISEERLYLLCACACVIGATELPKSPGYSVYFLSRKYLMYLFLFVSQSTAAKSHGDTAIQLYITKFLEQQLWSLKSYATCLGMNCII